MIVREYRYPGVRTDHVRSVYTVRERRLHVPEVVVMELWNREATPGRVFTSRDGQRVRVVKPGKRGRYAGPDIRDAVLEIDGRIHRGDIEIHANPEDWFHHGHHLDTAYGSVLLHVVLWSGGAVRAESRGCPVRSSVFFPPVEIVLSSQITTAFRPALAQAVTQTRTGTRGLLCRSWNDVVPRDGKRAALTCMAAARFERKREEMENRFREIEKCGEDAYQVLFEYCARSLGYAANAAPMQRLARGLPLSYWRDAGFSEKEFFPVLVVAAGLEQSILVALSAEERQTWLRSVDRLRNRIPPVQGLPWVTGGVRPFNHPRLRLRILASWIPRFLDAGWRGRVCGMGRENQSVETITSEVRGLFQPSEPGVPPLGRTRLTAVIVNVLVPWLSLRCTMPEATALRLFCSFPFRAAHSPARRVLDDLGIPRPWNTGDEQGALELYHGLCRSNRCDECLIGFIHHRVAGPF